MRFWEWTVRLSVAAMVVGLCVACGDEPGETSEVDTVADAEMGGPDAGPADAGSVAVSLRVMTMNIGTTPGLAHDGDDAYTQELADIADELYENSLSWNPAERALVDFFDRESPDIFAFQEGFWDPWCERIAVDPELDFVCRDYAPERPKQVTRVVGEGFTAACGDGQEDNCVAVRNSVGRVLGCDEPVCAGALEGSGPPSGCSNGARVGRVEVELADGRLLTIVNVHGTSGFDVADGECRRDQFRQVFEDRGDGEPAANGAMNLVLGDFNTDPVVSAPIDVSAAYLAETVAGGPFEFLSPTDRDGPASYLVFRIDHVLSDVASGTCVIPGSSDGTDPVLDTVYWDHRPVLCDLVL